MGKELKVYIISDSVGETAQKMFSAVIAQFPEARASEIKRFPFVKDIESLTEILKDALIEQAIVITTLVNKELVNTVSVFSKETALTYVDYMSPLSQIIEAKTGMVPLQEPGTIHQLNKNYFSRVASIEFAVRYDDGKDPRGFKEADYVILGVSRTSKTPLSMYLANKNYKVANLPLIPEVPLPQELFDIPKEKLIGLTTSVDSLLKVRRTREITLGLKEKSSYTDITRIQEELAYANNIFISFGISPIDISNKAIEETAMIIEGQARKFIRR